MTQDEYDLLDRIDRGESVFRPDDSGPGARTAFAVTVRALLALRADGWVEFPDARISRDAQGWPLQAGPCDVTEAGRRALAENRGLGSRGT